MGLRMDDIHTPTVPSGPTTSSTASHSLDQDKRSLLELADDKKKLEEQLSALGSVLNSHGVNMTTPLTTFDGFPRPDIDVAQIRTTRARIIHLRNDYKALMARIETGLHAQHAEYRASPTARRQEPSDHPPSSSQHPTNPASLHSDNTATPGLVDTPFARVKSVEPKSPADEAGLKVGDRVRRIEDINWVNHEVLTRVAALVNRSQGKRLMFKVVRRIEGDDGNGRLEELELGLVPSVGNRGQGFLGCQLRPL